MFSRSPRDARSPGILPPIRTTYDDSFHPLRSPTNSFGRLDAVESRLDAQEQITKQLIDRAIKIKQDIMENINYTHGTWQAETEARELLQEHVKALTNVTKQLTKDTQILSDELKNKDISMQGASNSLKTLETQHVAGITDLRGRVVRADASIAKLAADIKQTMDSVRALTSTDVEEHQKLMERMQHADSRLNEMIQRLERLQGDVTLQIKSFSDETSKHLEMLNAKARSGIEEIRHSVNNLSVSMTSEIEKIETRMFSYVDKHLASRDSRFDKIEGEGQEFQRAVLTRVNAIEEEQKRHLKIHADLDSRLRQFYDTVYRQQASEVAKLKRELREGFGNIHETISNMKSVLEGRQKLLEESLRRQINEIRKMVVLI